MIVRMLMLMLMLILWDTYMELAEGVAELVGGETGKESSLLA